MASAPPSQTITLYNETGACSPFFIFYYTAEPNLGTIGWNDLTKSFRVTGGTFILFLLGTKITIQEVKSSPNLTGDSPSMEFTNIPIWGGSYGAEALTGISSFRPLPSSGLVLFNLPDFSGAKYVPTQADIPDLNAVDFRNQTYSLIVLDGVWEIYDNVNYTGNKWLVSVDGGRDAKGWYSQVSEWGGNINILSVRRRV